MKHRATCDCGCVFESRFLFRIDRWLHKHAVLHKGVPAMTEAHRTEDDALLPGHYVGDDCDLDPKTQWDE
jgi:hypothetical protein